MASNHTIVLKKRGTNQYDEYECSGVFKPGHYLMLDSNNKVKKHNTAGGVSEKLFATEDALQGKTITGSFVIGEVGFVHHAMPGDIIHARLAAAAVAVVKGDGLISAGDGTLAKVSSFGTHTLYSNVASSAEVENTTVETAFDKTYTIPANTLVVGDVLRMRFLGTVNDNNSTDTLVLKLKIGTQIIVATAAVDVADADIGLIDVTIQIRTIGASGTFTAYGTQSLGVPGTVTALPFSLGSTAINTTIANLVSVTATWSVAHADNEVELTNLNIERASVTPTGLIAVAHESVDNSGGAAEVFCAVRVL